MPTDPKRIDGSLGGVNRGSGVQLVELNNIPLLDNTSGRELHSREFQTEILGHRRWEGGVGGVGWAVLSVSETPRHKKKAN